MKVLLVTPPFSQLNTPYPATCYLKGHLSSLGFDVDQVDMGIVVINRLFSRGGLEKVFKEAEVGRIGALKELYLKSIDPVMEFLRGGNPTIARRIIDGDFLPRSDRFESSEEELFPDLAIDDRARYLATLYLNDIADYIRDNIDPGFGFSRYSERLGLSPASFTTIKAELERPATLITNIILEEWRAYLKGKSYDFVSFTIPFPGNLISALLLSTELKRADSESKVILGGGWVNTELRTLSEPEFFEYTDYVVLDDGEMPLTRLLKGEPLHRTFILEEGEVVFKTEPDACDLKLNDLPAPDYSGLDLSLYISLLDSLNPMHSLWNRGRWNKMTLAHGCYWKRCAFCDTTLPYIRDYDQSSAAVVVDKMQKIIEQTGETGFHFVDEAAPPGLLKELSLEILRRELSVTWWTNIRFEKHFSPALAELMAKSGCIAVSGGVEVASDRLLTLMDKGTTVDQVTKVCSALGSKGIMVHAYLMYGFPTQTDKETIDALEIVRQLFKLGLIHSAYWHQFALTAHSSVGHNPKQFGVTIEGPEFKGFARNDLEFSSDQGSADKFSRGLKTSLYNYMRGNGLDLSLSKWFDFPTPKPSVNKNYIKNINSDMDFELKDSTRVIWLGVPPVEADGALYLFDSNAQEEINCDNNEAGFIIELTKAASYKNSNKVLLSDVDKIGMDYEIDTDDWLAGPSASILYSYGLILL